MKKAIISAIILFSESIWIYYIFALFISIEWDKPIFVHAIWWIIAGILGYGINRFIAGKIHYAAVLGGNALVVIILLIQNWKATTEGTWIAGVFFSIAVVFVYVRSASFVYKESTRMQMLQRFEVNLFLYLALLVPFTFNNWVNDYFHLAFLGAIFGTLFGMILTLGSDGKTTGNRAVEVHQAGNPSGFIAIISLLFISVISVSSVLFLPVVREHLQQFSFYGMGKIAWGFQQIGNFFKWIFSFLGPPNTDGALPEAEPEMPIDIGEMAEEELISLPIGWILAGIGLIVVIVMLVVFGHFFKKWRSPAYVAKPHHKRPSSPFRMSALIEVLMIFFERLKKIYRTKFARFYKQEVYWYFHKVRQWGKKRGISMETSETSGEYIEKLIHWLEDIDVPIQDKNKLIRGLQEMNQQFEAAYYGDKIVFSDFKQLVKQLKKMP